MNIDKLIQISGYILGKYEDCVLNYTKLIKILYLADRKSIQETGYSITGDVYVSMKNGPVLSNLYDLIKNLSKDKFTQYYWNTKFATDGYNILKICNFIPTGNLSDYEMDTLDFIDTQFHDKTYSEMIDFVHDKNNCPEWVNTDSSIPLSKEQIMHSVGLSDEDIQIILDEEKSYEEEEKLLQSLDYPITEKEVIYD